MPVPPACCVSFQTPKPLQLFQASPPSKIFEALSKISSSYLIGEPNHDDANDVYRRVVLMEAIDGIGGTDELMEPDPVEKAKSASSSAGPSHCAGVGLHAPDLSWES